MNGKTIAIDARMIEMSGIGTYIQHLMGRGIYEFALGEEETIRKYDSDVKVISYSAKIYSIQEQLFFPNKKIKDAGIQLIHFPHYNVPLAYLGDFVVTVHDLTHIVLPDAVNSKLKYFYAKLLLSNAVNKAKHIFTVSNNSKKDIIEVFGIQQQKISITYDAIDSNFKPMNYSDLKSTYVKYGVDNSKRILLYVGNLKTHKNLYRLLEAFEKQKDDSVLLLVGKAFSDTRLEEIESKLGIQDRVIHTGIVSKNELIELYNIATLFVFPSLYEGFGIPPLEAMACKTPVVCSNNSSLPEVVGNAAVMFNPYDVEDMANTIYKVLNNQSLLDDLIKKGNKQCKKFNWEDTAEEVRNSIRKVLE